MDALVKKALEWLERYWHKKHLAFITPIATSAILFLYFYSTQSGKISTINLVLVMVAGLIVLATWILTNRLPRVKKGNAGIVIGVLCDGPDEDKQVKIDFIANLRLLMQQGDSRFQLVELPSWALDGMENFPTMNNLLTKVHGHFLLYGRVRLRNKDGKPAHLLSFEGIVRHRPTTEEVQKSLAQDFSRVLPRRVVIEKENDAFSFEATSEWTDVSTRYIVGTAALISGDVAYAENLFLYVESKPIAYDPMLDYWLRMICGAFTLVGVWYLALALWPRKFAVAVPFFGWLMIVEGVILLVSGLRLGIGPFPFYGDVSACFLGGAGILFFARSAKS